jgi:hypothetical protein
MTQIHISDELVGDNHGYTELHRIGSFTFKIEICFYLYSIEYSGAAVHVLSDNREWTELGAFSVNLWYDAAKAADTPTARVGVFKTITEFLLNLGREATGIAFATPATGLAEIPAR